MDIYDKLIDLRISLTSACDGFSVEQGNKNILLSSKVKVLYLLSEKDLTPAELIACLGMAKSNLANLTKSLVQEKVIESYKTLDNMRNVYYRITDLGQKELQQYKESLQTMICKSYDNLNELEVLIDGILKILKKD